MKKESLKKLTNLTLATTLTVVPTISPIAVYATPQEELELVDSNQIEMSEPIELDVENAEEVLQENELQTDIKEESFKLEDGLVESMTSNTEELITSNESLVDDTIQSNNTQTEIVDIAETPTESSLTSLQSTEEFNLADWTYSEDTNYITLTKYIGTSRSLIIPGQHNGKQIRITSIKEVFPQTITELSFQTTNNQKVLYDSTMMTSQFSWLINATTLDLSGLDTSRVTTMRDMFKDLKMLTKLDLSGIDTSNVTQMSGMFAYTRNLISLDLSSLDTSKVTDMSNMFYYASGLETLDLSSFDTSNVKTMSNMFAYTRNLSSLDLSSFDTSSVSSMSNMFCYASGLKSLDLSLFNTSNVTDMSFMFAHLTSLETLDLSSFDTSSVRTMKNMFDYASGLKSLNLSSFDTSNVTDMSGMFYHAYGLKSLDLSSFDTSNVTDMSFMFGDIKFLETLDLSSFNTSKVTDMSSMFTRMSSLKTLDLRSFDTSNVTRMRHMFSYTHKLSSLDLSSFNTSKVSDMHNMFLCYDSIPLLIIANSKALKNYDFKSDYRLGVSMTLNANGGVFANNTTQYKTPELYVISSAEREDLDALIKQIQSKSENPTHSQYPAFEWVLSEQTSNYPLEEIYQKLNGEYQAVWGYTFETFTHNNISESTTVISGQGEPGATISIYLNENCLATTIVDGQGNYTLTISQQQAGTVLTLKQMKNEYLPLSKTVTVLDEFKLFTVQAVTSLSDIICGVGEEGATVQAFVNGEQIGESTQVDSEGKFKITIPNQEAGSVIELKISKDGYKDLSKQITVMGEFDIFTYNTPSITTTLIQGEGIPGAEIGIYDQTGTQLAITTVHEGGTYELTIPAQPFGTILTLKQMKSNYITLSKEVVVLNESKHFTIETTISASTTEIVGSGEPGFEISVSTKNGEKLAIAFVDDEGNYQLSIPTQQGGSVLTFEHSKEDYHTFTKEITVLNEFETFAIKTTPTISTTAIYGTGVPGATVGIYTQNGTLLDSYTVNSKGNYKLVIPKQKVGEVLTIKQSKDDYLTVSKNITVLNEFETFTIKTTPTTSTTAIYGTGVSGSKVGVYDKNGKRLALTTVNSKGNFKLTIPKQKGGTVLTVKQAKNGYLTVSKNITVLNEFKTFTIKTNPTSSTTAIYGTGVAGSKIGIYDKNGRRLAITTVNSKGNFKLTIPKQKAGTVLTLKQAKSGYLTVSKNITVFNEFKTFSVTTKINSKTTAIYGKGVSGAKVGIYDKNGKRLAITTVNSKGNYKLTIPKQKVNTILTFKQAKSGYLPVAKNVKVTK